jgi:hypothetical protein
LIFVGSLDCNTISGTCVGILGTIKNTLQLSLSVFVSFQVLVKWRNRPYNAIPNTLKTVVVAVIVGSDFAIIRGDFSGALGVQKNWQMHFPKLLIS